MMRKFVVAVLGLVLQLYSANVYSQNDPIAYRIGINANLPYVSAHIDTFDARTGFGFWGNTEFDIGNDLRFLPGLAYNSFGYNQNFFSDSGVAQRRKITEHYIDVITELNYLPSRNPNSLRVNFGMGISFLANRTTDLPDILDRNITQRTLNNKKPFTPNFIAHLGLSFPLSKHVELGAQYTLSMPHKIYPRDVAGRLGMVQIKLGFKMIPNEFEGVLEKEKKLAGDVKVSLYNKDSLVLLVRLKENKRKIELLTNEGYYLDAEEEKRKTLETNLAIVDAFKEKFTLLPVYYFYDSDSKTALEKGFTGILLNENLVRDSSYRLPPKDVIIAEFGRQFDEVTQTSGMYGLVIYGAGFKSLASPFPSFTSNAYGILSKKDVVEKFQKKLSAYLNN